MSDEPDVYDEPYRGTQILWGRVIVLLLALALAFWLGTTFGGDSSAETQLEEQRAEIAKLESEVAALEAEVAAVDAGTGPSDESPPPADEQAGDEQAGDEQAGDEQAGNEQPGNDQAGDNQSASGASERSNDGGDTTPANAEGDAREYVVQTGDSLAAIAQEVYGDPTLWREIADANDIDAPFSLTVGDTLVIPAEP
jgi:nucleoid-associated protein YgaU